MYTTIDVRGDDIISISDIRARLDYLQELRDAAIEAAEDSTHEGSLWVDSLGEGADVLLADPEDTEYDDDANDEYHDLSHFVSEYIDSLEPGASLILDSHFEDYAREEAEDIHGRACIWEWPFSYIDWDAAATALQQDYTVVELAGDTYYTRG